MLTQQSFILALASIVSVSGSNGQALAESTMAVPFVLTASKALVTSPKPFIEVSSTEGIYISEGNALTLADTQCLHTETPQIQLCFGNRWPTRVRLLPHRHLNIGLHSLGLSQLQYTHHPSFVTEALFPGQDALSELNPTARAIATQILQGIERQTNIVEQARQRSLVLSRLNNDKSHHALFEEPTGEGDAPEESAEEDSELIEWWGFAQPPAPDTNDNDLVRVRFDHNILLKPDTRYCFAPGAETKAYRQTAPDEGSGSEDNGTSDENSDNDSNEEDTENDTDPDVQFIGTTQDPFPVSKEIREYCANLEQRKIKQELPSDSELPMGPEKEVAADSTHKLPAAPPATRKQKPHSGKKSHPCQVCGKVFTRSSAVKRHQRTHSGEKPCLCTECGRAFAEGGSLKRHQRIHSGEKPYPCQTCGKAFSNSYSLKTHQRIHSGEKPYLCKVCGKTFAQNVHLKKHQRIHSGEKPYLCKVCGKTFVQSNHLRTHQRTHSGEKPYPCKECGKAFADNRQLKKHLPKHTKGL